MILTKPDVEMELIAEKLEDLRDIRVIQRIKEGKPNAYLTADQISAGYSD